MWKSTLEDGKDPKVEKYRIPDQITVMNGIPEIVVKREGEVHVRMKRTVVNLSDGQISRVPWGHDGDTVLS